MSCREISTGRWVIELSQGLGLEVILLFSKTVAFWRYDGELVAEVCVGEA